MQLNIIDTAEQSMYLSDTIGTETLCSASSDELFPYCQCPHPDTRHIVPTHNGKYDIITACSIKEKQKDKILKRLLTGGS